MRQNVRNRPYTYYVVQPTALSTAEKATRVIDKSVKKKKISPNQNRTKRCLTKRSHQRRHTDDGDCGGSGSGRQRDSISPHAIRDNPTTVPAEL
jgi:hypothetical protein